MEKIFIKDNHGTHWEGSSRYDCCTDIWIVVQTLTFRVNLRQFYRYMAKQACRYDIVTFNVQVIIYMAVLLNFSLCIGHTLKLLFCATPFFAKFCNRRTIRNVCKLLQDNKNYEETWDLHSFRFFKGAVTRDYNWILKTSALSACMVDAKREHRNTLKYCLPDLQFYNVLFILLKIRNFPFITMQMLSCSIVPVYN